PRNAGQRRATRLLPPRAPGPHLRLAGADQRPDRRRALPLGEHDQEPSLFRFREVRCALAPRGRRALPRARTDQQRHPVERRAGTDLPHSKEGPTVSTATAPNALPLAATEGTSVPFIRLDSADPELFAELMEVVERIARNSAFTLGPELERFEAAFAEFCGTEYAAGVSSGTAALEIALRALGIGPGDEVIVPTYSFIATAEAVSTVGATPVIVDIDPETALITAETVERALTERTRCVIPVHLFGRPV